MKNLILILSFTFVFITVNAQSLCPHVFKCGSSFIDPRDGYSYPTVQIGTQCWFQVNLHATKYVNGDAIPFDNEPANNDPIWLASVGVGAWCDYNNSPANGVTYGHLYNWYAAMDSRGLCPLGWYVPSYKEMTILYNYLGGESVAGGAMATWVGTNSSGFDALMSSSRNGHIDQFDYSSDFLMWTSTVCGTNCGYYLQITLGSTATPVTTTYSTTGEAVRCVKDF